MRAAVCLYWINISLLITSSSASPQTEAPFASVVDTTGVPLASPWITGNPTSTDTSEVSRPTNAVTLAAPSDGTKDTLKKIYAFVESLNGNHQPETEKDTPAFALHPLPACFPRSTKPYVQFPRCDGGSQKNRMYWLLVKQTDEYITETQEVADRDDATPSKSKDKFKGELFDPLIRGTCYFFFHENLIEYLDSCIDEFCENQEQREVAKDTVRRMQAFAKRECPTLLLEFREMHKSGFTAVVPDSTITETVSERVFPTTVFDFTGYRLVVKSETTATSTVQRLYSSGMRIGAGLGIQLLQTLMLWMGLSLIS